MVFIGNRSFRSKLGTEQLFVKHERVWWILGQKPGEHKKPYRYFYYIYSFVLNVSLTIAFPFHLAIGLLFVRSPMDVFNNLAFTFTAFSATLRSFIIWWNFKRIKEIERYMCQLDECLKDPKDIDYFKNKIFPAMKHVSYLFYFLCIGIGITAEVSIIASGLFGNWRHLYPAFFPFDSKGSPSKYVIGHLYQVIGTTGHIFQNFVNDTYGGMCIAYLAGHVRLLGRRVSRIGFDEKKTLKENNDELVKCIKEHQLILTFHDKLSNIVSYILFLQLLLAAVNMSIIMIFIILYVNDAFGYIFFIIYIFAMPMEIYPCCYYGSKLEIAFADLTDDLFQCNWINQNQEFTRNLRIFLERTLRPVTINGAGIVRVNLVAFLTSLRMTYSLYMFVSEVK